MSVKTADGFLAGTNSVRSNGETGCKFHYVGKKLLMLAGFAGLEFHDAQTGRLLKRLDIDQDLWKVFNKDQPPETLLQQVAILLIAEVKENNKYLLLKIKDGVEFHLVLLEQIAPSSQKFPDELKPNG